MDALLRGESGCMVGLLRGDILSTSFEEACKGSDLDERLVRLVALLA